MGISLAEFFANPGLATFGWLALDGVSELVPIIPGTSIRHGARLRSALHGMGGLLRGGKQVGQGFKSFNALKKHLGSAGSGYAWHHIVEQCNIERFGPEAIHNINNIVRLPHGKGKLHNRLTGLYNSKNRRITGSATLTVREWLSNQSFDDQYKFGLKAIRNVHKGIW